MNSRENCVATLYSAAKQAKELATYLINQPYDFTALRLLAEVAVSIRNCARALQNRELWRLGERLIGATQMDLSTPMGVAELDSTVSRVISVAERFGHLAEAKGKSESIPTQLTPDDPFSPSDCTQRVAP